MRHIENVYNDLGSSSEWKVLHVDHSKIVCSRFDGCELPLHECLFYRVGFRLTLNKFDVGVMNHLGISSSKLHPMNCAYIKVFHYW